MGCKTYSKRRRRQQQQQQILCMSRIETTEGGYICAADPTLLKHSGNSAKLTADPEQETITKAGKQLQAPTGPTKPRTVCRSVRL